MHQCKGKWCHYLSRGGLGKNPGFRSPLRQRNSLFVLIPVKIENLPSLTFCRTYSPLWKKAMSASEYMI
ncbi:unnamed protein product [Urochloa humidicola]